MSEIQLNAIFYDRRYTGSAFMLSTSRGRFKYEKVIKDVSEDGLKIQFSQFVNNNKIEKMCVCV